MYKLSQHDQFQIEELYGKIEKLSDRKWNIENIYSRNNKEIAQFITRALEIWYEKVTSSYKWFTPIEEKLYGDCLKIRDKLLMEKVSTENNQDIYFSVNKIDELKQAQFGDFNPSKLIRILEEVNLCYGNWAYLAVSSLLRMLIDHIPPIFKKLSFSEVVNNYSFSQSDKKNMQHLLWSLKNISDWNLHNQIWRQEILPDKTSIEFRADFDVLLKNIILILNK